MYHRLGAVLSSRDLVSLDPAIQVFDVKKHAPVAAHGGNLPRRDHLLQSFLGSAEVLGALLDREQPWPKGASNLEALAERLLDFQYYWENSAQPFQWKFKRADPDQLLTKLKTPR